MTAYVIRGDARRLPLADASVDLVVTSPPFYALRSYTDGGEHYARQIGAEPTPGEYIDNLIACTREWMRVLKPSGSCWVNLGDKYSTGSSGDRNNGFNERSGNAPGKRAQERSQRKSGPVVGMQPKTLLGLPWRYALRCIDELGLILRRDQIWSKVNGLPESVTDRCRSSHEYWFHLTKEPKYYAAVDRIRQPYSETFAANHKPGSQNGRKIAGAGHNPNTLTGERLPPNPLGALPGSVWEIPTQPLKVPAHLGITHYAAFPMELPRRIIQGWSPAGVCTVCGEGRRPVADRTRRNTRPLLADAAHFVAHEGDERRAFSRGETDVTITGEACGCPDTSAPTTPGIVLDPFAGTGTTMLVAKALGRVGIGVDMSMDYSRLAVWRTTDPGQLAAALEVDKPPVEVTGQDDLLTLLGGIA